SQGVVRSLFLTKLTTIALTLFAVASLGSGAALLAHQALTEKPTPAAQAEGGSSPNRDVGDKANEQSVVVTREDTAPAVTDQGGTADPLPIAGAVVHVDQDGKGLRLKVPSKVVGQSSQRDIKITDATQLLFSNVGPNEATLTEGYAAEVWLERAAP